MARRWINMKEDLPPDAEGDAIRRLEATGSDLSRPMIIDFHVAVPNKQNGREFAAVARVSGFTTELWLDEESGRWTCSCSKLMLPQYQAIVDLQQLLARLGAPFLAISDGWGSVGNALGLR